MKECRILRTINPHYQSLSVQVRNHVSLPCQLIEGIISKNYVEELQ